jgi:uncharacterized protein (TIGR02301 family)
LDTRNYAAIAPVEDEAGKRSSSRQESILKVKAMQASWRTFALAALAFLILAGLAPVRAQVDSRPYDERLMRLSELLGAVHYLRELCGANDGQLWRERMRELIDADGAGSALRRSRLTKSFNNGYRSFRRSYQTCSPTAQATLNKFMTEGLELSDSLTAQQ